MHPTIEAIEREQLQQSVPEFKPGDSVKVHVKVIEGEKERIQVFEGLVKSLFFGAAIALVGCYKGFTCGSGASGVGRACTESFVASFIAIIVLNFVFAQVSKDWYIAIYGVKSIFGS